jgi:hypothetical protein
MKRFALSLIAGVAAPGALLGLAVLLDVGFGLEALATPFYWIIAWPIYVFSEVFPGEARLVATWRCANASRIAARRITNRWTRAARACFAS